MRSSYKKLAQSEAWPKGKRPEQRITEAEQRIAVWSAPHTGMRQGSNSYSHSTSRRLFALVLLRGKTKPGAVTRAKPFSHYWSIWFSTRFPLRAQRATGCILKFLDRLSCASLEEWRGVCASPSKALGPQVRRTPFDEALLLPHVLPALVAFRFIPERCSPP